MLPYLRCLVIPHLNGEKTRDFYIFSSLASVAYNLSATGLTPKRKERAAAEAYFSGCPEK